MQHIIRRLVVIITLLQCSGFGYAQTVEETSKQKIRFGVKGGVALSNIVSAHKGLFEGNQGGIVLGGFIQYRINKSMVLQPEILFIQKGEDKGDKTDWLYSSDEIGPSGNTTGYVAITGEKLSYISIPINIYTDLTSKLKLIYGIEPSFLHSTKYDLKVSGEVPEYEHALDGITKKIDFGLNLGLSYSMSKLNLDFRLSQGIVRMNNLGFDKRYNSSIQLTLGYLFN